MMALLQTAQPQTDEVITALLNVSGGSNFSYAPTTTAFEDIKSSGKLNLIRDSAVKTQLTNYYTDSRRILDNVSSNARAMDERIFRQENMLDFGLGEIIKIDQGFDTSRLDMEEFRVQVYKPAMIIKMKNMALFFIAINSRNLQHFKLLQSEIIETKALFLNKCPR